MMLLFVLLILLSLLEMTEAQLLPLFFCDHDAEVLLAEAGLLLASDVGTTWCTLRTLGLLKVRNAPNRWELSTCGIWNFSILILKQIEVSLTSN